MTTEDLTIYLEDVDASYAKKRRRPEESEVEDGPPSTKASAPEKRQRTLDTMFNGSQDKKDEKVSLPLGLKVSGGSSSNVTSNESVSSTWPAGCSESAPIGVLKLNAIPFSLSAYQESLSDEVRTLLQLECEVMGKSWLKVLKDEIKKPYFIALKQFLWKEGVRGVDNTLSGLGIYPPPKDIYSWSNTPLGKVKVVILGQDPYHGRGQAHGLCFSVPVGIPVPPSLRNVYTEIKAEYPAFNIPGHGNLSCWANNGVLMLNACLTVREGQPNSHENRGWEQFTDFVLGVVDKYGGANLPNAGKGGTTGVSGFGRGVVFLAWGAYAAKRVTKLDKKKHLILTSAHPSPFSAHKGFLGNGHFKAANQWLEERYGVESRVDWCCLD